jgi:flagellar basal body-associated protein FliL
MAAEPAKKESAPKVQPIKPRKRGKLTWIVLAAAIVVLGGGGAWFALRSNASTAAPGGAAPPAPARAPQI